VKDQERASVRTLSNIIRSYIRIDYFKGLRFGMLQSKVGLTTLLKNFKIKVSNRTKVPLTMEKNSFITTAEGGIWLDVEKLN
jgi:hypothetical protein